MYSRTGKFNTLIVFIILFAVTGCSSFPSSVYNKGIVAWNYKPIQSQPKSNEQTIPVSVRVNNFESKPSKTDLGLPGGLLRLIPIVSFFAPPFEFTNKLIDDWGSEADLKEMEIEKILAEEIRRSGIYADVELEGEAKDFDINGTVNFSIKDYRHLSGLGIVYMAVAPALIFPGDSMYLVCETHISVVSNDTNKLIFKKDYIAKTDYLFWAFYGPFHRHRSAFGEELFPQIIEQFIADMKALPKTAWEKSVN